MAKVLLIDDNSLVRDTLRRVLARAGHVVETAADGAAGLAAFAAQKFDAVISDIFMPNEDGIAVISKIRAQSRDVCIIAISGAGSGAGSYDALRMTQDLGADYILQKPIVNADLVEAIAKGSTKNRMIEG
jgi:CheY-like chemotaxis protein